VRNPEKARDLAQQGVQVRQADYGQPAALEAALSGIERLLLISSSEVGQRATQHRAVIEAARRAGVGRIAYTSILHADTSPLALAREHVETEKMLAESGLPFVLLRNGWYTENRLGMLQAVVEHGALIGAAKSGRLATATRADYADAAAAVLLADGVAGLVYELAGDTSYTLADLAAEIARQSGKPVVYRDLPEADYKAALMQFGLPEPFAALLADSDAGTARGALDDDGRVLSRLIGRPTTPMAGSVRAALGQ
jgi:NAD(P)H dehydrogenase (quinone)